MKSTTSHNDQFSPVAAQAKPDPRTPADMFVNGGALKLALNALRRAGKNEIADELEKTAAPAQHPVSGADGLLARIKKMLSDGPFDLRDSPKSFLKNAQDMLKNWEPEITAQPLPSGNAGELPTDEREAFESAFKSEFIFDRSSWSSKGYAVPSTQSAWEGWQARAALAQHQGEKHGDQ